jgi:hypothetical protein
MKSPLLFGLLLTLNISSIALTLVTPTAVVAETTQQQAERHNVRGGELFQANNARGAIADFRKGLALARAQNDDSSVSLTRDALRNMGVNE